jgi:hypothetical protein
MPKVELREIRTEADRRAVLGLRRGPRQEAYLNSMEDIFAEADEEARAMPPGSGCIGSTTGRTGLHTTCRWARSMRRRQFSRLDVDSAAD